MSHLIDTNICSAYLKGSARIQNKFMQHGGGLSASVITVAELKVWQLRSSLGVAKSRAIAEMYQDMQVLDVGQEVAIRYAEIRASLLDAGRTVPVLDLLIAATALTHNLVLVTHNVKDFAPVPDLIVIDWLEP
ncbi:MAG: type II toxin-antitoxin system VapC family toxin [Planctomycetota bacterium]